MTANNFRLSIPQAASNPVYRSWNPTLLLGLASFCVFTVIAYYWGESWFGADSFIIVFSTCLISLFGIAVLCRNSFIAQLLFLGFFIRVIAAIFIFRYLYLYYGFRGFEGNDDLFWDKKARLLLSGRISFEDALKQFFSAGYVFVVTFVYELGGYNPFTPRIMNAFFGTSIILAGYHLVLELFEDRDFAKRIAWWLTVFPVLIIWSANYQKDILISLCMTTGILACIRFYKRGFGLFTANLFFASLMGALLLRVFAGHTLIILAVFALLYRAKRKSLIGGSLGVLIVIPILFGAIYLVALGMGRTEVIDLEGQYSKRAGGFEKSSQSMADGHSSGGVAAKLAAAPRPVRLLIGPVITLISPVPPGFAWENNFGHSIMSVFQPLQIVLLPYFLLGIKRGLMQKEAREQGILLLMPPIIIALVANSFYAVGQITKYRIMIEPILLIVAGWVFHYCNTRQRLNYLTGSVGLCLFAIFSYVILKHIF